MQLRNTLLSSQKCNQIQCSKLSFLFGTVQRKWITGEVMSCEASLAISISGLLNTHCMKALTLL